MPEELKVDCFECRDLEFARNLEAQMRDGYGRHNSSRSFRRARIVSVGGGLTQDEAYDQFVNWRENQQARVIGRIGNKALRERWQDCEIGDAVPEHLMQGAESANEPYGARFIEFRTQSGEPITFERVCFRVRSDGDCVWRDQYVWKRIE